MCGMKNSIVFTLLRWIWHIALLYSTVSIVVTLQDSTARAAFLDEIKPSVAEI